jgi:hypothetical protein
MKMFMDRVGQSVSGFVEFIRKNLSSDLLLILPAVVLVLRWPMFLVLFGNCAEAFMSAFVLVMALRFTARFDLLVLKLGKAASPRAVAVLVLVSSPGIRALLIWQGEPIWASVFSAFIS